MSTIFGPESQGVISLPVRNWQVFLDWNDSLIHFRGNLMTPVEEICFSDTLCKWSGSPTGSMPMKER